MIYAIRCFRPNRQGVPSWAFLDGFKITREDGVHGVYCMWGQTQEQALQFESESWAEHLADIVHEFAGLELVEVVEVAA
ncbi:hypothetical protein [Aquabacterium sp.]|uniref:hypothetical protein n=1 Tax=Aquabacterium sp. TaxID=1872578 RepID=UPI0025BACF1C|nr:hypothetical protein [Aquabacterium sp.]